MNPTTGCPSDFVHTLTATGDECLKLVSGKEQMAAFLETRRYAAYLGAITEFRKEEGITFNPDNNKLYVAMSQVAKGMTDGKGDIDVEGTDCGAVYELDVDGNMNVTTMRGLVAGTPSTYEEGSEYAAYTCDKD